MRVLLMAVLAASLGCGEARSPASEDACGRDDDCSGGLVCCHAGMDMPKGAESKQMDARGFCVKETVCTNVVAPPPAAALPE